MVLEVDCCRFRVLGPVQVETARGPVALRRPQHLDLLAYLLLHADRVLPVGHLVDAMWGDCAPRTARVQIKNMVSELRRCLADNPRPLVELDRLAAGYRLRIIDGRLDLDLFAALRAEATAAAKPDVAVRTLRRALGLWRGEALAGVRADFADAARAQLQAQRVSALEDLFDAELACANHLRIVAELTEAVADHPGRERLAGQLMVALYRGGRATDALAVYRQVRQTLIDEYGLEPGHGLRELERSILLGDRTLDHPPHQRTVTATAVVGESAAGRDRRASSVPPIPAQLPCDIASFVGRTGELARLDRLVSGAHASPATVVISAVMGTAGIGKTALAVHWAHRVADRFPDGQFYVNLKGYGPRDPAMGPAEAVRGFLDALGVPPERIPSSLDAQAALYRSLMAGRRMLVVLDNAADAEQVRPLLPGAPGCFVLVTSRSRLESLVVAEAAIPITLDLPSGAEARNLLAARLGAERVAAERQAVAEIVTRCSRLPLALAVVAARATVNADFPLASLSAELSHAREALEVLTSDDAGIDVRTVFSWSYERLSAGAAGLFRMLGLHPGQDLSTSAAASLAGVPAAQVRSWLGELANAHLVSEHKPGRYTMHDLLRAYAAELAHAVDSEPERRAALCRILEHYLHTASSASDLIYPHRPQAISLMPLGAAVTVESLADHQRAWEWFDAEHRGLVAAVEHAAANELAAHTWQLASAIGIFLYRRCHWQDWASTQRSALAAAERAADRVGQAHTYIGLGTAHGCLGDDERAHICFNHAAALFGELGDQVGQANAHLRLSATSERQAEHADALHHAERALALFRAAKHRAGFPYALNSIGWCHALLGRYREAIVHCQQAVALHLEVDDRQGAAQTLDSIGYAHHQLGEYEKAASFYRRSADLLRESGGRNYEAIALTHLGDSYNAAGKPGLARDAWLAALRIFDALSHPGAEQVTAKIRMLETPPGTRSMG